MHYSYHATAVFFVGCVHLVYRYVPMLNVMTQPAMHGVTHIIHDPWQHHAVGQHLVPMMSHSEMPGGLLSAFYIAATTVVVS
jgi:hypothetical protein